MAAFGLMAPISKFAMVPNGLDGPSLAVLRIVGAAVVFSALALVFKLPPVEKGDFKYFVGMALTSIVFNQGMYITGLQLTSPLNGSLINIVTPIAVMTLSLVFLGIRITWCKALGVAISLVGVVGLVLSSAHAGGKVGSPVGDLCCVISQISCACYYVFFVKMVRKYHPLVILSRNFSIAAVLTLPVLIWKWTIISSALQVPAILWPTMYVVFMGTVFAYICLIIAQHHLPPPTVAIYNYIQPIIAGSFGILMGVDELTIFKVLAALFIISGVSLVTRSKE